jgi:hypothetical protein
MFNIPIYARMEKKKDRQRGGKKPKEKNEKETEKKAIKDRDSKLLRRKA